jgi:hypothetical protein
MMMSETLLYKMVLTDFNRARILEVSIAYCNCLEEKNMEKSVF